MMPVCLQKNKGFNVPGLLLLLLQHPPFPSASSHHQWVSESGMVPIIGTFEAQEQRTVLGRCQPTRSITKVCAYNMRSRQQNEEGYSLGQQMLWAVWGESYESTTTHFDVVVRRLSRCFYPPAGRPAALMKPKRFITCTKLSVIFSSLIWKY